MVNRVCERYGDVEFELASLDSLDACLVECDARPDCTAVTEIPKRASSEFECVVYTGPCELPRATTDEVDQYLKICEAL
jgi:hypothetical protein